MPCFLACEAPKTAVFTVFFWSRRLSNISETPQCDGFRGPARITSIINNSNDSKHLSLVFFVLCFFCRSWCGDALYTDTLLQTDGLTHSSLYTEQRFTQRCFCTAQHLCTDAFTHRRFYTEKPCTEQLLHEEKILPPQEKKTGKHVFELGSFSFPDVSLPDKEC